MLHVRGSRLLALNHAIWTFTWLAPGLVDRFMVVLGYYIYYNCTFSSRNRKGQNARNLIFSCHRGGDNFTSHSFCNQGVDLIGSSWPMLHCNTPFIGHDTKRSYIKLCSFFSALCEHFSSFFTQKFIRHCSQKRKLSTSKWKKLKRTPKIWRGNKNIYMFCILSVIWSSMFSHFFIRNFNWIALSGNARAIM